MGHEELAVAEPDISLDARKAVVERVEQRPRMLVVVVSVCLRKRRCIGGGCRRDREEDLNSPDVAVECVREEHQNCGLMCDCQTALIR